MFVGHLNFDQLDPTQDPLIALTKPLLGAKTARWADSHMTMAQVGCPVRDDMPSAPIRHESGLVLAGDVRLDNRERLLRQLMLTSHAPKLSDGAIVLHAYRQWGTDCLDRLYGDFAFVIWDPQYQALFAARDVAGVRPLYYSKNGPRFIFSAHQSAVRDAASDLTLNWHWVARNAQRRLYNHTPADETPWANVMRLPAAHGLLLTRAELKVWHWWHPRDVPALRFASRQAYVETLRDLLAQAVASRLAGEQQVGAHLSGRLDSSAVAMLAARQQQARGRQLPVYSWSPNIALMDYLPHDERRHVEAACEQMGMVPHYTAPTVYDAARLRMRRADQVLPGLSFREPIVRRLASEQGVSILLSGLGGHRVISAESLHIHELYQNQKWWQLWRAVAANSQRQGQSAIAQYYYRAVWPRLPRRLRYRPKQNSLFRQRQQQLLRWRKAAWHPDMLAQLPPLAPRNRPAQSTRAQQQNAFLAGDLPLILEAWAIYGWESGIEYRYPLLDRQVLAFGFGMPTELLFVDGYHRWLFRQACAEFLPTELCWQPKRQEPAIDQDRLKINQQFGRKIVAPFLSKLFAEVEHCRFLNRSAIQRMMQAVEHAQDDRAWVSRKWWGTVIAPLSWELSQNKAASACVPTDWSTWA